MIQVACEAPFCWMEEVRKHTDYDYALAHLILENPDYAEYFIEALDNNRKVILDNSAFELESSVSEENLIRAYVHLQYHTRNVCANLYVIAPDVLGDSINTRLGVSEFISKHKIQKTFATIQGSNIEERIQCFQGYMQSKDIKYITVPVGWSRDENNELFVEPEENRIEFLKRIDIPSSVEIHLLGLKDFNLLQEYKNLSPNIVSIDTSYPVLATIEQRRLSEDSRKSKIKVNNIFNNYYINKGWKKLLKENIYFLKQTLGE